GRLFGPGSSTQDIADYIRSWFAEKHGADALTPLPPPPAAATLVPPESGREPQAARQARRAPPPGPGSRRAGAAKPAGRAPSAGRGPARPRPAAKRAAARRRASARGAAPTRGYCIFHDDMDRVYEALHDAHAVVVGSPIYFDTVSGPLKLVMDRCNCITPLVRVPGGGYDFRPRWPRTRRGVFVAACSSRHR